MLEHHVNLLKITQRDWLHTEMNSHFSSMVNHCHSTSKLTNLAHAKQRTITQVLWLQFWLFFFLIVITSPKENKRQQTKKSQTSILVLINTSNDKKQGNPVPSLAFSSPVFCLKTYIPKYLCNFHDSFSFKNIRNSTHFFPSFTKGLENRSLLNPHLTSGNWNCQAVKTKCLSNKMKVLLSFSYSSFQFSLFILLI